jgi:katanin p80 WD40 repeat-containing subunit B1
MSRGVRLSEKVHEFVADSTQVNCLAIGPKSQRVLATGGEDFKVYVWRIGGEAATNIWKLGQNKSPIECLSFDTEEQYLVSGALNG